jgi:hypothetical protein
MLVALTDLSSFASAQKATEQNEARMWLEPRVFTPSEIKGCNFSHVPRKNPKTNFMTVPDSRFCYVSSNEEICVINRQKTTQTQFHV